MSISSCGLSPKTKTSSCCTDCALAVRRFLHCYPEKISSDVPPGGDYIEQADDSSDVDMEGDQGRPLSTSPTRENGALDRSGGAYCRSCGGFTEEAYFRRWEGILGGRLAAADEKFSNRRVREGRRKLEELQVGGWFYLKLILRKTE